MKVESLLSDSATELPPPTTTTESASAKRKESPTDTAAMQPPKKKRACTPVPALKGESKPWTAADDIILRDAMTTSLDIMKVSRGHKFSFGKATPTDVEERWQALLYDPVIGAESAKAMAALPQKQARAAWSDAELALIEKGMAQPNFKSNISDMILKNRPVFHWSRTAKLVENHSYRLKAKKSSSNTSSPTPGTLNPSEGSSDAAPKPSEQREEDSNTDDIVIDDATQEAPQLPIKTEDAFDIVPDNQEAEDSADVDIM